MLPASDTVEALALLCGGARVVLPQFCMADSSVSHYGLHSYNRLDDIVETTAPSTIICSRCLNLSVITLFKSIKASVVRN